MEMMSVIYAVSDLHGCYDKYIKLLERLKMTSDDSLYILGDIVDRGSDGMKILWDLIKRKNVFSCRGNHDHCAQILLRSFAIPKDGYFADGLEETFRLWLSDGGSPTYPFAGSFEVLQTANKHTGQDLCSCPVY